MRNPAEIIALAQQLLIDPGDDASASDMNIRSVLDDARRDLETYFSHQPAPHVAPLTVSDPKKARVDIERYTRSILLGVMTRAAIFEALEHVNEKPDNCFTTLQPVDYSGPYVDPYPDYDGEHQFMTAMVRELDAGLLRFYQRPTATAFRLALRDVSRRLETAQRESNVVASRVIQSTHDDQFDPWTCDPAEMFAIDTDHVQDRIRQALRHNAETAMQFLRLVCPAILNGFEAIDATPPTMKFGDIQALMLRELPTLLIPASIRTRLQAPEDPQERQRNPLSSEALICDIRNGDLTFRWASTRMARPHKGGRCPANSMLTALSDQQQRVMDEVGVASMSTAEALMRLAVSMAPYMFENQYEAQRLCTPS